MHLPNVRHLAYQATGFSVDSRLNHSAETKAMKLKISGNFNNVIMKIFKNLGHPKNAPRSPEPSQRSVAVFKSHPVY